MKMETALVPSILSKDHRMPLPNTKPRIAEDHSSDSGVKITNISTAYYEWKRPLPLSNGMHTYSSVRMAIVKVETDAGITGYGLGGGKPGEPEMRENLARQLIGRDPTMTERIWADFWIPKLYGRRGFETRALSSIDLALWDIKAKMANMPLYRLLGGFRKRIPTYVAGGYYAKDKGLKELQAEVSAYVERGARAVKMKVGAMPIADDAKRVKAVREAIGPDVKLMIDANCAYRYYQAVQLAERVQEYDVFWFEEAVQPDDYEGFRKIAAATSIPLATGENEYTKHGFRDLISTQAIAILQPDARRMGGVTEFMKVAALAQAHGLDICPHGDQQAHIQLLGAVPNGLMIEFYPKEYEPMHGKVYLETPELQSDGTVIVPETPGLGLTPNEAELAPFRISV
jgi:L-alanine-DL-glutamate epimerase-like enolase superfamily enzyme